MPELAARPAMAGVSNVPAAAMLSPERASSPGWRMCWPGVKELLLATSPSKRVAISCGITNEQCGGR